MKTGMFPGQIAALRREVDRMVEEERQRGRRRAFLGSALGIVGGSAVAWLSRGLLVGDGPVEAKSAGAPQGSKAENIGQMTALEALAVAPTDELVRQRIAYIDGLERSGGRVSETAWLGFERLSQHALSTADRRLAAALLDLADAVERPDRVQHFTTLLRRLAR